MCTAAVPRDITADGATVYRNAVFLHIVRVAVYCMSVCGILLQAAVFF